MWIVIWITLALALLNFQLARSTSDEVLKITFGLMAGSFVCFGLVFDPWMLKLLILAGLLLLPTCHFERNIPACHCPRFCLFSQKCTNSDL